jgi:hypothetical protein
MIVILFGLIAGIITGLGMGGGTILILLLSVFLGQDQHVAQATNLIFFIPTSIAAIYTNLKYKNVNLKLALTVSSFGVLGAIIGATISSAINSAILKKIFAVFILIIAIYEIYRLFMEYKKKKNKA